VYATFTGRAKPRHAEPVSKADKRPSFTVGRFQEVVPVGNGRCPVTYSMLAVIIIIMVRWTEEKRDGLWGYIPSRRLFGESRFSSLPPLLSFLFTTILINYRYACVPRRRSN
jgi:hypothetical protein